MSFWPLLLPLLGDLESLNRLYKHDLGVSVTPYFYDYPTSYYRLRHDHDKLHSPKSLIGKDGFQVNLNVRQFNPSDLNVKTIDDYVVIEGKHDEREDDHGYVSRQFVRRYQLPKGYDADKVTSTLSSDGILTVKVPAPPKPSDEHGSRAVEIQQTGPSYLSGKERPDKEEEIPELLEREKKIGRQEAEAEEKLIKDVRVENLKMEH